MTEPESLIVFRRMLRKMGLLDNEITMFLELLKNDLSADSGSIETIAQMTAERFVEMQRPRDSDKASLAKGIAVTVLGGLSLGVAGNFLTEWIKESLSHSSESDESCEILIIDADVWSELQLDQNLETTFGQMIWWELKAQGNVWIAGRLRRRNEFIDSTKDRIISACITNNITTKDKIYITLYRYQNLFSMWISQ